ncbi:MAG: glycosyltransferase [Piscinibacter sp.]|uniref:glycosyltransferase n=1 Tax=Piscinibacter sp. TaxID=1903157 RepID=UPI003D09F1E2
MKRPLVSVILPTYNCGRFVADAIDSVLSQTYQPIEVVVVDDGSTDDTLKVVARFGDRVRVFTQANAGPAAARNRAVSEARGEYLAFLDGDDLWLPGHTETLMGQFERQSDCRVVYGGWLVWHPNQDGSFPPLQVPAPTLAPRVDPEGSGWLYSRLLFDSVIHIIASVIHRSVFDAVGGFDQTLRTGSDYDFWLKVSRRHPAVKLDVPVAVYRQNHSSVTYTLRKENNAYRLLNRAIESYGLVDDAGHAVPPAAARRRLAALAFLHGYRHYWDGDADVAVQSFRQALSHHPWQPKAAAYLLASLARCWGLPRPTRGRGTAR